MFLLPAEKHNKIKTNTEPGQTINKKNATMSIMSVFLSYI